MIGSTYFQSINRHQDFVKERNRKAPVRELLMYVAVRHRIGEVCVPEGESERGDAALV